jgi:hypothetical protein
MGRHIEGPRGPSSNSKVSDVPVGDLLVQPPRVPRRDPQCRPKSASGPRVLRPRACRVGAAIPRAKGRLKQSGIRAKWRCTGERKGEGPRWEGGWGPPGQGERWQGRRGGGVERGKVEDPSTRQNSERDVFSHAMPSEGRSTVPAPPHAAAGVVAFTTPRATRCRQDAHHKQKNPLRAAENVVAPTSAARRRPRPPKLGATYPIGHVDTTGSLELYGKARNRTGIILRCCHRGRALESKFAPRPNRTNMWTHTHTCIHCHLNKNFADCSRRNPN